jgi:hypothetical protein
MVKNCVKDKVKFLLSYPRNVKVFLHGGCACVCLFVDFFFVYYNCYVLPGLCASGLLLPHPVMYKPTTSFSLRHFFIFILFLYLFRDTFIHSSFFSSICTYNSELLLYYISLHCYTKLCFLLSIQRFWRFTQNPVLCSSWPCLHRENKEIHGWSMGVAFLFTEYHP